MKKYLAIYTILTLLISIIPEMHAKEDTDIIVFSKNYDGAGTLIVVERLKTTIEGEFASNIGGFYPELFFLWMRAGAKAISFHSEYIGIGAKLIPITNMQSLPRASKDPERDAKSLENLRKRIESNTLAKPTVLNSTIIDGRLYMVFWNNLWTSVLSYQVSNGHSSEVVVQQIFRDSSASHLFARKAEIKTFNLENEQKILVQVSFSDGQVKSSKMDSKTYKFEKIIIDW